MTYGMINCFACGDYVYDRDIEKLAKHLNSRSSTQGMKCLLFVILEKIYMRGSIINMLTQSVITLSVIIKFQYTLQMNSELSSVS